MKKLLLFSTLLLTLNLDAATTETKQNDAQTAKQTEVTQTKIEKKPSFLVRHADKLKKISYITSVPLILLSTGAMLYPLQKLETQFKKTNNIKASMQSGKGVFMAFLCKFTTDLLAIYAMNVKSAYFEEQLKKSQNQIETSQE
jgi:hypothetical protein